MRIGKAGRRAMAVGLVLAASSVVAGRSTQILAVSATVSPSAVVDFEMSAQPLKITSADLDRGYVEVVMKSRMRVATGHGNGARPAIVMDLEPRADVFRGVSMASSSPSADGQSSEFRYRFEFARNAREGQYGNAISVTVDL